MNSPTEYRVWAEVDLDALANNLRWIRFGIGDDRRVITVVKADAYGHGLPQIAGHLMRHGTDTLGVANLAEAAAVRSMGKGWPILMLGACHSRIEFETLCRDNVAATLSSKEEILELIEVARRLERRASVHLKVDTGMGRLGAQPDQVLDLARRLAREESLSLDGIYTHLSSSEDDAAYTAWQVRRFRECLVDLKQHGIVIPTVHVMNSGGIIYESDWVGNYVRPGLLVYGIVPPGGRVPLVEWGRRLRPVLSLKSRVTLLKQASAGSAISYGQRAVCGQRRCLATVSAGYGDGILRSGGGRMRVLVGGRPCAVVGAVTMDQMIVDVSSVPSVQRGDEVVIIGTQGDKTLTAVEQAQLAGSIPWEVLTSITQRVPRVYKGLSV